MSKIPENSEVDLTKSLGKKKKSKWQTQIIEIVDFDKSYNRQLLNKLHPHPV